MIVIVAMISDPKVMGGFAISYRLRIPGWACVGVMCATVVNMFVTWCDHTAVRVNRRLPAWRA